MFTKTPLKKNHIKNNLVLYVLSIISLIEICISMQTDYVLSSTLHPPITVHSATFAEF